MEQKGLVSDLQAGPVCLGLISMSIRDNLATERNLRSLIAKIRSEARRRAVRRGLVPLSNDLSLAEEERQAWREYLPAAAPHLVIQFVVILLPLD